MTFHGFVQAGGASTRFGEDKALVKLAGKSMLDRTGELLQSVCHDVTIVAAPGRYNNSRWPVLADRWPGDGPLGGILTALHSIDPSADSDRNKHEDRSGCPFALILSCDMPFLTAEFLRFLMDRAQHSEAQVIVPEYSQRLEPLCACWCAASLPALQAAFESGVRKVSQAMKHLPMEVLDESAWKRFDNHGRLFQNMNTPEDYKQARRIFEIESR
ncbi:MAG TPA: molybdenum cofactor guanylyltransferase [Candidatus Sulfotelmatobacter sp.]|nr:molybdenum cofactor guanylyltransferase [Candidatus Sulfotelmatobacter sp.]